MKTVGNKIIVSREKEATKHGDLYLPEQSVEKPSRGLVLVTGPKVEVVDEEDTVVFGKYAGTETNIDGQQVVIISEDDVLAVE